MPTTCGIIFVLVLALSAANTLLVPQPAGTESGTAPLVAGFITGIIQSFVIAPLAIATNATSDTSRPAVLPVLMIDAAANTGIQAHMA